MALKLLDIRFSNQAGAFYAGQTVSGIVLLELDEAIKVNAITIKFRGTADVSWEESSSTKSTTTSTTNSTTTTTNVEFSKVEAEPLESAPRVFEATESYIDKVFNIYGGGHETRLNAGSHRFDFSFHLPMNIPSSFEGDHGNVRYTCKTKVERPGLFSGNWEKKVAFTVISLYDLNNESRALEAGHASEVHTLGCLCCVRGDINTTLSVPRIGYVGGEDIYFTAIINNNSTKGVQNSKFELIQEVTYKAEGHEKEVQTVINTHKEPSLDPMDTQTVSNLPLRVPPLPPSGLIHCSIIDLRYKLKLEVVPSGFHMNVVSGIELIIGTIPLRSTFANFQPQPPQLQPAQPQPPQPVSYPEQPGWGAGGSPYAQNAGSLPTAPLLPVQDYPEMPPPSYAESMFRPAQTHRPGELDASYFPRYPYYNAGGNASQSYYPPPTA